MVRLRPSGRNNGELSAFCAWPIGCRSRVVIVVVAPCRFVLGLVIASSASIGSVRSFGPSLETPFCSCVPRSLQWFLLTPRGLPRSGSVLSVRASEIYRMPSVTLGLRVGSPALPGHPASLLTCVPSVERLPSTLSRRPLAEADWRFGYGWRDKPPSGTFHPDRPNNLPGTLARLSEPQRCGSQTRAPM